MLPDLSGVTERQFVVRNGGNSGPIDCHDVDTLNGHISLSYFTGERALRVAEEAMDQDLDRKVEIQRRSEQYIRTVGEQLGGFQRILSFRTGFVMF